MSDRTALRRDRRATGRLAIVAALAVVLAVAGGVALVALTDDEGDASDRVIEAPGSLEEVWRYRTASGMSDNHHQIAVATVGGDTVLAVPVNGLDDTDQCGVEAVDADGQRRWRAQIAPANCSAHAVGHVATGDVDGDAAAEFGVSTGERAVLLLNASSGEVETRSALDSIGYSAPLFLDGDAPAIVVADFTGGVHAYDANGTHRFSRSLEGSVWASPVAIGGDGEAIAAVAHGKLGRFGELVVLDADGGVVRRVDLPDAPMTWAVDEEDDAVAATWSGEVVAADLRTGERRWTRSFGEGASVGAAADGRVHVTGTDGTVSALDRESGETVWSASIREHHHDHEHEHEHEDAGGHSAPAPITADVDDDGDGEVVAVGGGGSIGVLAPDGGELLAHDSIDGAVLVRPTSVDLEGDGDDEVLVLLADGRVVALSYAAE